MAVRDQLEAIPEEKRMTNDQSSTTVRRGFVPFVSASSVDLRQAGAVGIVSRGDLSVKEGGAQLVLAGGDITVREGGAQTILSRGDITIREGGALAIAGANVDVTDGWVGVALGAKVHVDGARVLLGPIQALCLGAGLGAILALSSRLLRR